MLLKGFLFNKNMGDTYNVVFEYTEEVKGYAGNRFRTSYKSKEQFEEMYTPDIRKRAKVIAQGISDDKTLALCLEIPTDCRISACLEKATDSKGNVNPEILRIQVGSIVLADILQDRKKIILNKSFT